MAKLNEVLADRTAYPDDREFSLPDGTKTTVGEMRNSLMPKSDYTRESQRWSEDKQKLEQDYTQRLQASAYQMQQMQAEMQRLGQPNVRQRDDLDAYRNDPNWAPVVKRMDSMFDVIEKQKSALDNAHQRLANHEQAWWINQHAMTLKEIQRRDPEFASNDKVKELLSHAQQYGIGNLDLAYRDMVRDRDLKKASEDAEKRGYDKAKTETGGPHIPTGAKGTSAPAAAGTWQPPADIPDAHSLFNKAEDAALSDSPEELERIGADFSRQFGGR